MVVTQKHSMMSGSRHFILSPSLSYRYCLLLFFVSVARKPEAIVSLRMEGSALQGHLIKAMHSDNELLCALACLNTRNCFSFNYSMNSQLCELNHTNRLTSSDDLILNPDSAHYEMVFN